MDITSSSTVGAAAAGVTSAQDGVQITMLDKALNSQTATAAGLIEALPQMPKLATSGNLGTQVNTYA